MEALVSYFLIFIASVLALPVVVFLLEILAGIVLSRAQLPLASDLGARPPIAVVVPAHNESSGLLPALTNIQAQLFPHDRLLVVADNCSDDTADVARAAGAEVVERNDLTRRGKGYALDWGVRHLGPNAPEIVVIVDADCKLADRAIDNLAYNCAMALRPVQALYLMTAPIGSSVNYRAAEFSWRVKNWSVRLAFRLSTYHASSWAQGWHSRGTL
jgi:glycosyltransferase involved in cell wall biosynthesis